MRRLRRARWILFWIYVALTVFGTYFWGDHPPDWITWPWVILMIVLVGWKILDLINACPPSNPPPSSPPPTA